MQEQLSMHVMERSTNFIVEEILLKTTFLELADKDTKAFFAMTASQVFQGLGLITNAQNAQMSRSTPGGSLDSFLS